MQVTEEVNYDQTNNPPTVGAPELCNGGHNDAGIPLDLEIVDTCHGLLPSLYME